MRTGRAGGAGWARNCHVAFISGTGLWRGRGVPRVPARNGSRVVPRSAHPVRRARISGASAIRQKNHARCRSAASVILVIIYRETPDLFGSTLGISDRPLGIRYGSPLPSPQFFGETQRRELVCRDVASSLCRVARADFAVPEPRGRGARRERRRLEAALDVSGVEMDAAHSSIPEIKRRPCHDHRRKIFAHRFDLTSFFLVWSI